MRRLLVMECSKALRGRWFRIALGIALALALTSAALHIARYLMHGVTELYAHKYVSPACDSAFRWWISLDGLYPTSELFFQLMPLLAVMPYAWSQRSELQDGYSAQVYTRTDRTRYALAKYLAAALSGGLVVAIPLIANFLAIACFIPAYMPNIYEAIYLGVFEGMLWSELFYSVPVLYTVLYTLLAFALCALWAGFVCALSFHIDNRVILLVAPYLAMLAVQFVNQRIFVAAGGIQGFQLDLVANMRACLSDMPSDGWIILAEGALLAAGAALLIRRGLGRDVL